ncbi:magnesium-translocating P-type ATPase [Candidatus Uhrbacteria bacterium]|nr:magnesium-translocating P-type ATPase [Candidatus Uhrbacteria bacterium]
MNAIATSAVSVDAIAKQFRSSTAGLSSSVATQRLAEVGPNALPAARLGPWRILLRQLGSPFIALLAVVAALSIVLGTMINGAMVILFIAINTVLGFYQEYRSERSLETLGQYIQHRVRVRRGGKTLEVGSRTIVPGDLMIVEPGDRLAADLRITAGHDVLVDESILSGESAPVHKNARTLAKAPDTQLKAANILFAGTTVVEGRAEGIVVATGRDMAMGEIAQRCSQTKRESGFEKGVRSFSYFILKLVLATLVLVFIANILLKGQQSNPVELIIFSIALAVSVIPEALPVVMTFSLSRGALKLAKQHVVVKRLSAVEDLGSMEVLCTDKTGTITQNKLRVADILSSNPDQLLLMAAVAGEPKHGSKAFINSFDRAIDHRLSAPLRRTMSKYRRIDELPFDPIRRRNSVVVEYAGGRTMIMRGAMEELLESSALTERERIPLQEWSAQEGSKGRRVIAVAIKSVGVQPRYTLKDEASDHAHPVTMVGLISFVDPIKPTTRNAIVTAKRLGLKVKILSGDSPEVASAVGKQIGLIEHMSQVMTGSEFERLSAAEQLKTIETTTVFARVSPQQKYHIIELLKHRYEVGYLGDGINDAPALKIATVGLVVDGASDVARESADIVLLDKSLYVIVNGIQEGRMIFANTVKYIKSTLASNFGNFYTVAIASLLIDFLPMLPLQILLVNLLSDFPMIAVATDSVDHQELTKPRRYDIREVASIATILGLVSSVFDFMVFAAFYRIGPQVLQTNWFIASILTELLFIFAVRTHRWMFAARRPSMPLMLLTGVAAIATIVIPYSSIGHSVFQFVTPRPGDMAIIIGIAISYMICTEAVKLAYYRHLNNHHASPPRLRVAS